MNPEVGRVGTSGAASAAADPESWECSDPNQSGGQLWPRPIGSFHPGLVSNPKTKKRSDEMMCNTDRAIGMGGG